jgi:glutamate/tyrosine decarboxylase-like PLP-dependent enzyme
MQFIDDLCQLMKSDAFAKGTDRNTKVLEFLFPEQLKDLLDLAISDLGACRSDLMSICKNVIKYSFQSGHPRHFNLLHAGLDPAGMGGAWLTDALNCNLHTYEAAPVFTVIENFVIDELSKLVGFVDGDGIFVPGSSFGTMLAIHLARYKYCPDIKKTGLFGLPRLSLFCSTEAHFSVMKAASFLGFGTDNVISVETDCGRMKPQCLEEEIVKCKAQGCLPLAVIATCGTTVLGAFDPINDISALCQKHGLWLHIDAAWGGGALFSSTRQHLLSGVEKCDSFVWSLHKLVGAQIQCSVLLVKEKGQLEACNSSSASYLFQNDKFYDVSLDVGDKTVQCGRKVDSFKFWLMWKARGRSGMTSVIETAFDNARYFTEKLKQRQGFRLVQPEFEFLNVCFWYIPTAMRDKPETEEWWQAIHKVAPRITEGMMKSGTTMLAYLPLESKGLVNFFRLVTGNPATTHNDMDFLLDEIDRLGCDL